MKRFILLIPLFLFGCLPTAQSEQPVVSSPSPVSTATPQEPKVFAMAQPEPRIIESDSGILRSSIDWKTTQSGITFTVEEVLILPSGIDVSVSFENVANKKMLILPSTGAVIIGNQQLDINHPDSLSGDIFPGVQKTGVISAKVSGWDVLQPAEINEIELRLGEVLGYESADREVVIYLKVRPSSSASNIESPPVQPSSSPLSMPTPNQSTDTGDRYAILTTQQEGSRVNLRDIPSSQGKASRYGLDGDRVLILDQAQGDDELTWYKVKFPVSGAVGWVRGDFVEIE